MAVDPQTHEPTPILLGTSNPAKQHALANLLEGLPLSSVIPGDLGLESVPEEQGESHEAIAQDKAKEWSRAASMLAIASDGGMKVPALGSGWESRFTHRFAGDTADDRDRISRLLELMEPYEGRQREASWVEALAVANCGEVLASWAIGGASGEIATAPDQVTSGRGFWAFSLWYFPQYQKFYNQLSADQKIEIGDHWSRLRPLVTKFFAPHLRMVNS